MTHLLLGLSAWNSLFSRFLYLCTCCSSCFHCLRLRISDSKPWLFISLRTVFGILVVAVLVQPELHSAIAVGILTPFLLTCNLIYDCLISGLVGSIFEHTNNTPLRETPKNLHIL